jgi:hypothetical protein
MQIQIDDSTYDALREYASRQRRSVTVVVRELLAKHAPGRARTVKGRVKTSPGPHTTLPTKPLPRRVEDFKLFGCFASGRPEDRVSERQQVPTGKQKPRRRNHDAGKLPPHTTPPRKIVRSIEELTFIGSASSGRPEDRVSERHDEILGEGRW